MEMDGIYTGLQNPSEDVYSTVNQPQGKRAGPQQRDPTPPASAASKASSYRQPALVLFTLCCLLLIAVISLTVYYFKSSILDKYCPLKEGSSTERVCCPEKWVQFNGKCYYFSTDTMDWNSSRDNCTSMGGHLVIIESEAEQRFLLNAAKAQTAGKRYWIGLTDGVTEGVWRWVDGTPLNEKAQYWASGEPNDYNEDGEDCAHIPFRDDPLNSWNDILCKVKYTRICETIAVIIHQ
ncbi:C-type lectin domain family 4 member E-like [Polyodon spathula]|uniref:C-type lectin domain family 4 member E-like n=1 Tax=Polyodon spathula TaxID=7913 RepID=UPI001B7D949D|nr:C-type lectin domain family 4 member E-like [Polyodon spathula]